LSIYNVTAPMTIRYPDGEKKLIIHHYQHAEGLLYFEPWWHTKDLSEGVHLITGTISGDGPWKINDHVITVTGCHGSDFDMASLLVEWQQYLAIPGQAYPEIEKINYLAKKLGAITTF